MPEVYPAGQRQDPSLHKEEETGTISQSQALCRTGASPRKAQQLLFPGPGQPPASVLGVRNLDSKGKYGWAERGELGRSRGKDGGCPLSDGTQRPGHCAGP